MHISEGVLTAPVLLGGAALTTLGTALGLRAVDYDRLMRVAILSAFFFVASLVHVPVGPSSAHLVLNGLLGLFLGWAAFPAILVGLTLQAVLFQYGGITTLGVNTFTMAAPAVLAHYVFRRFVTRPGGCRVAAFLCGGTAVLGAGVLVAVALALSGDALLPVAQMILVAHLPVAGVEGVIAALTVSFLLRARPEMLAPLHRHGAL
ncbi:cobalt transporter CbiM [Desulfobaculum senezii]|jgi:cobalt/nickel transport system permease protein|uniref:cobalt transporter CbiM n=1 Tax=Desulfobaculum sp. SPO524 TaxID=3378071 RepID=UPI003852ECD3